MYTCLARLSSFVSLITSLRISYATVETKLKEDANFLKIKSGTIFSSSSSSSFSWEGDETEKIFIGYSPMTYTHTHTQQPKLARYIIVLKDKEEKKKKNICCVCAVGCCCWLCKDKGRQRLSRWPQPRNHQLPVT
jgi:hypothetical protein